MITQFGIGGISLILDKSAFQSLSDAELFQLHKYFRINITPILVMEVLGDLKKGNEEGINSARIIDFSKKLSYLNSTINGHFANLIFEELLGNIKIPFYSPLVDTGELRENEYGKRGVLIHPSIEREALDRWKQGDFTEVDALMSKLWRELTTNPSTILDLKKFLDSNTPELKVLKNQEDILNLINITFDNEQLHLSFLEMAIKEFGIPPSSAGEIFYRWETLPQKSLYNFAPYTFFCLRTKLLFNICLQLNIIGTRATNLLDMEYIFYLPFCRVFVSDDILHKKLVPFLITADQFFVTGKEIKEDLIKIATIKEKLSEDELRRATSEPPRVEYLLIYKIWKEIFLDWPREKEWVPSEEEMAMMHEAVRNIRNSKKVG